MATENREAIFDRVEEDNPQAADALDQRFSDAVELAAAHPLMYRLGRIEGTREIVAHPNYVIVYRVQGDDIEVLRILHTAQQFP